MQNLYVAFFYVQCENKGQSQVPVSISTACLLLRSVINTLIWYWMMSLGSLYTTVWQNYI